MRAMVIVKATESSEKGVLPSEELLSAMGQYNEELVKHGIMKSGDGLKPSSFAKRIRFKGNDRIVSDGPFADTSELIAGFWIWEVESIEHALEWVRKCPNPMLEESDIDIRPLYEAEDFVEADSSGSEMEHEKKLVEKLSLQSSSLQPYLFFGGRCEEALNFYEQALGAVVLMKMRFDESPDAVPEGMLQSGFETKIMHASLKIGKMTIMASDGCDDTSRFNGFRLALSVATESSADAAFHALASGGKVDMPLTKTFWSPRYGMVTDKFGVAWMVMVS
jgi:PhnB protein